MLKKRVITAIWGIPLLVAAIWFGQPWFTILVAIWGLLAVFEFYRMVASPQATPITSFGLIWTLLFILSPHLEYDFLIPLLLASAVILPLIWLLIHRQQREKAFTRWVWTIGGILYIGWLLSYLVTLRTLDSGQAWVFFTLFTTFSSDTSAFFVGRAIGKHRLAPSLSPGKTWEGAIAGVIGAIIISLVLVTLTNLPISYGSAILLSVLVSIFGQVGDLVESLVKRNAGVKDSGKLVPGHGGFLDRIDSIILASVVVYYYVIWVV